MKKSLILLAILTVLILCAVPVIQSFKLSREQDRLTRVSVQLNETQLQAKQLEAANERLVEERRELRRAMHQLQARSAPAVEPAASGEESAVSESRPPAEDAAPVGRFLDKMMADPDMRQFVRDQQRQMLDPLYQPLIKQLDLTKEEADAFKDFLADTQMQGAEQFLQMQQTVNHQVYQRAAEGLSPDQLEAFGRFQTNPGADDANGHEHGAQDVGTGRSGIGPPHAGSPTCHNSGISC